MANQPPQVNPSPRTRFQMSPDNISKHRDLIATREFDRACDFALLEYQGHLSVASKTQMDAMESGYKAKGAIEFLAVLRTLGEQPQRAEPRVDPDNLMKLPTKN